MRVLYDISVEGVYYNTRGRTGVFRVVDEVARRLAENSGCELTLCASRPDMLLQAVLYHWETPELRKSLFALLFQSWLHLIIRSAASLLPAPQSPFARYEVALRSILRPLTGHIWNASAVSPGKADL